METEYDRLWRDHYMRPSNSWIWWEEKFKSIDLHSFGVTGCFDALQRHLWLATLSILCTSFAIGTTPLPTLEKDGSFVTLTGG